jgi:hypothetical protein
MYGDPRKLQRPSAAYVVRRQCEIDGGLREAKQTLLSVSVAFLTSRFVANRNRCTRAGSTGACAFRFRKFSSVHFSSKEKWTRKMIAMVTFFKVRLPVSRQRVGSKGREKWRRRKHEPYGGNQCAICRNGLLVGLEAPISLIAPGLCKQKLARYSLT